MYGIHPIKFAIFQALQRNSKLNAKKKCVTQIACISRGRRPAYDLCRSTVYDMCVPIGANVSYINLFDLPLAFAHTCLTFQCRKYILWQCGVYVYGHVSNTHSSKFTGHNRATHSLIIPAKPRDLGNACVSMFFKLISKKIVYTDFELQHAFC